MGYMPMPPELAFGLSIFLGVVAFFVGVLFSTAWHDAKCILSPKEQTKRHKRGTLISGAALLLALGSFFTTLGPVTEHWRESDEIGRIAALLSHPTVAPEKLMEAAQSSEERWQLAAASHTRLPDEGIVLLAQKGSYAVKLVIAGRRDAPPDVLVWLANDDNSRVADKAIRNRSLPADHVNMEIMNRFMEPAS